MADEGKRCTRCGVWRPLSEYYPAKGCRDGLRGDCKTCFKERAAARYRADPEPAKKRARDWAQNNPDRVRARMEADKQTGRKAERDRQSYIRRTYGITEEAYDALIAGQKGRCAICGTRPSGKARLHLDHDHETGRRRGFLCFRCNNAIGDFSDNVALLRAAIDYLSPPITRPPQLDDRLRVLARLRVEKELLRQ